MSAARPEREQGLMALFTAAPQLNEAQQRIEVADYKAEQAREEACRYIRLHLRKRDRCELDSRAWHVERIKIDWWVKELLRVMGEA